MYYSNILLEKEGRVWVFLYNSVIQVTKGGFLLDYPIIITERQESKFLLDYTKIRLTRIYYIHSHDKLFHQVNVNKAY